MTTMPTPTPYDLLIVSYEDKGMLVSLGDPDAKDWMTHLAEGWHNAKYFQLQPKHPGPGQLPIVRINVPESLVYPVYFIRTQKRINLKEGETLTYRQFFNVGWLDGDVAIITTIGPFGNVSTAQVAVADLPKHYQLKAQEAGG